MKLRMILLFVTILFYTFLNTLKAQTVQDIDGNIYNTVTIGKQVWMKENLKVTKYSNGDLIGTTDPVSLDIKLEESKAKYQWAFEGDESKVEIYGRLYTWHAAADKRNICPTGWHVPSESEWRTLFDFLGGENVAGEKLKETGNSHWNSESASTNESGFSAVAGGYRNGDGPFGDLNEHGYWRSSTESNEYFAWYIGMSSGYASAWIDYNIPKENGLSVRCIKD